ncbi:hypothetical protein FRC10_010155 [Ceratobasidium sp. 414]|nr:hypothetical protein FRC10_010155 [Ceratobasidium sp. 414]
MQEIAPRLMKEIAHQVTSYITQQVGQQVKEHLRQFGRRLMSFSPISLEAIKNAVVQIVDRAKGQITQLIGQKVTFYRDRLNQLYYATANTKMTISKFCKLDLVGRITSIECFQEAHHEFILVHTRGFYSHTPSDQLVWIRLERGLKKETKTIGNFFRMITKTVPAYDTATISYHRKRVAPLHALPAEKLEFEQTVVTLKHLLVLLRMMDETASGYNLLKDNCWVFCQAVVDCMENYQPKRVYLRRPDLDSERRERLKRRFTAAITDIKNFGATSQYPA